MALTPQLSSAVHDLNARLGSILIAVSAVAELDLDAEVRRSMLTTASGETVRASAELAAIVALAVCALDDSEPGACDVAPALAMAVKTVQLHGIDVDGEPVPAMVRASAARVEAALPALLRLVGGASKAVHLHMALGGERLHFRLARGNAEQDPEPLPPVVGYLVEALGARPEADDGLAFSWPVVVT